MRMAGRRANVVLKMVRFQNWWDYHKWYVIVGIVLIWILLDLALSNWKARRDQPDFTVAYVARAPLDETLTAELEREFSLLAVDRNGDGKANVRINAYLYGAEEVVPDGGMAQIAADIRLIGDIAANESFLFLTDDAERLQTGYRILADAHGACLSDGDSTAAYQAIRFSEIGFFRAIESVGGAAHLDRLSIARRCYPNDANDSDRDAENAFWARITGIK